MYWERSDIILVNAKIFFELDDCMSKDDYCRISRKTRESTGPMK